MTFYWSSPSLAAETRLKCAHPVQKVWLCHCLQCVLMRVLMVCIDKYSCIVLPLTFSTLFDDQTLIAPCNSQCDCKSTIFEPVCSDGITYFSPYRAGCDKYFLNGDRNVSSYININNHYFCINLLVYTCMHRQ